MVLNFGMLVETSVTILLAVTIGYCMVLNSRLKRLHADRDMLQRMIGDLVQATALANSAVGELKVAAYEGETNLNAQLQLGGELCSTLDQQLTEGAQLIEKLARIMSAGRVAPAAPEPVVIDPPPQVNTPSVRLQSALDQLKLRQNFGSRAA
jgi:hypothetical protein